ncbi:MAG: hypothetical protein IPI66_15685 [Chitinophagaceae bacterium]|nr:hypothetical protein [Chitinophagaceae bacterium]
MKKTIFIIVFTTVYFTVQAQQVLMQGWYWDYPKTATGASWADTLRLKALALKNAGFTHVWMPPHTVSSSGTASNGFDPRTCSSATKPRDWVHEPHWIICLPSSRPRDLKQCLT